MDLGLSAMLLFGVFIAIFVGVSTFFVIRDNADGPQFVATPMVEERAPAAVGVRLERARRVLGIAIAEDEASDIFRRLGFGFAARGGSLTVTTLRRK